MVAETETVQEPPSKQRRTNWHATIAAHVHEASIDDNSDIDDKKKDPVSFLFAASTKKPRVAPKSYDILFYIGDDMIPVPHVVKKSKLQPRSVEVLENNPVPVFLWNKNHNNFRQRMKGSICYLAPCGDQKTSRIVVICEAILGPV